MIDCEEAFDLGYTDGISIGDNLNPYDPDTFEWEAYEDGYLKYINEMLAEAAELAKLDGSLTDIDY